VKIKWKPYFSEENSVFFSDGVEEVVIYVFNTKDEADLVSNLLNDAYSHAYQDGLNASTNSIAEELRNIVLSLTIENQKLKRKLNMDLS